MIPKPTTQKDALTNAILAAEEAHAHLLNDRPYQSQSWSMVADAWSRIACQLPQAMVVHDDERAWIGTGNAAAEVQPILTEEEVETILALRNGAAKVVLEKARFGPGAGVIRIEAGEPLPVRAVRVVRAALAHALSDEDTYAGESHMRPDVVAKYARKPIVLTFQHDGSVRFTLTSP